MAEVTLAQAIAYAAKNQLLLELTYNGITRLVEPYSYREASTGLIFFGYCYKDNRIEKFRVDRIEHAKVSEPPKKFIPRWPIEIS